MSAPPAWRPTKASRLALAGLAALSLLAVVATEALRSPVRLPHHAERLRAAEGARRAAEVLRQARQELVDVPADPRLDPDGTGLVGAAMSPTTSAPGYLSAKHTSLDPNFGAVLVDLLLGAGVSTGDVVAVGASGSFPALNIATLMAVDALGARPVLITSVSASQFGANLVGFTWLDMEAALRREGLLESGSVAASLGGVEDLGIGLPPAGVDAIEAATHRNDVQLIGASSLEESVALRMEIYEEAAGGPIRTYVNIGGGAASVGSPASQARFRPGLNRALPLGVPPTDGVMARFAHDGVPVIHLRRISELAARYELAGDASAPLGRGAAYVRLEHRRWLAALTLLLLFAAAATYWRRLRARGRDERQ